MIVSSFLKFLNFPENVPDKATIWLFRGRLVKTCTDKIIWGELQKQIDSKGLIVKKAVIQDATFITSGPGHKKDETKELVPKEHQVKDNS
jgi:IS5 family transposase